MAIRSSSKLKQINKEFKKNFIFLLVFIIIICAFNIPSIAENPQPDLEIKDLIVTEYVNEGDNIIISVIILNNGSENTPSDKPIKIKLFVDDANNPVSENSTKGLSAGAFVYLNLSWTAVLGDHILSVKLFYDGSEVFRRDVPITVYESEVDLVLNNIFYEGNFHLGEPILIYANATNIGKNTTRTVKASLYVDDSHEQSRTIEGLSKGETYNFSFEWAPKHFDNHTLNVTLDPENKIEEEDETNNYIEIDVFVNPYRIEWKSSNWHYRKFYAVEGTGNISISINFTMLLNELDIYEKTFENDTIMIIKYFSNGAVDNQIDYFKFQEYADFNNKTDASGVLIWNVTEEISYYCVYFDVLENNGSRGKIDEIDGITEIGDAIVSYERPIEGWWQNFIAPEYNYFPFKVISPIKISTIAEASVVSADLYWKGTHDSTIYLESNDNINWLKNHTFFKKGTWTITITAWDDAGFHPEIIQTENISVLAVPDLQVVRIILPSQKIIEGEFVQIQLVLNNTGYADAGNYKVGLYLGQDSITWKDNQVKNTTKVSIDKDESKKINVTWHPAIFGDPDKKGKWIVGIWVYSNSTHKDSDPGNNKGTNYSLNVILGEKNNPSIRITELTDQQELCKPVIIEAKITDESGIESVNFTIIDPEKIKYFFGMTAQENDRYNLEFDNTSLIGEYNFSIKAIDNSFYHRHSTVFGVFEIIEDTTPPSIDYFGAYPSVQLKEGYVNISCISSDFMGVKSVKVMLKYPDGRLSIKSMTNTTSAGKYLLNQKYDDLGKHIFNITSEDLSGNIKYTENKEFWITNDIDDIDGDHMPDWWENRYGFDPRDPSDAEKDEDGDGYTNVEEYNSGSHPLKRISSMQEIIYKLRENLGYLIISLIFFILIISLSLYGLKRQKT